MNGLSEGSARWITLLVSFAALLSLRADLIPHTPVTALPPPPVSALAPAETGPIAGAVSGGPVALRSLSTAPSHPPLDTNTAALVYGSDIYSLALFPDGRLLVGGLFDFLRPKQVGENFGRLNSNGHGDTNVTFRFSEPVYCIAVQTDSRMLVGGLFGINSTLGRHNLVRLEPDGSLDPTFNPNFGGVVSGLHPLPDGKILVSGDRFVSRATQHPYFLARLNLDGTIDEQFDPAPNGIVDSVALQPDGRILLAGQFSEVGGQPRRKLARIEADGRLDPAFTPVADAPVWAFAVQPDGRILVAGKFTRLAGQPRNYLGRLLPDGSLDPDFDPHFDLDPSLWGFVEALALQTDGRICVSGRFKTVGGLPRANLARLLPDGRVDPEFDAGSSEMTHTLALQSEGKLWVGGYITNLAGQKCSLLGRLEATGPATESLTLDSSSATWLRAGTGPEFWRTTFEGSTNGSDWKLLGPGTRLPAPPGGRSPGWELTGLSVPAGAAIRARGFVVVGSLNGSAWFLESFAGEPRILDQPQSLSRNAGEGATFRIRAEGSPTLGYAWLKDGTQLTDGTGIAGSATDTLTLTGVLGGDAGEYSVIATNTFGSAASESASLTVRDPLILAQPRSISRNPGEEARFSVGLAGTEPLTYRWTHDGVTLPQADSGTLVLPQVRESDIGTYVCTIANRYGAVTSSVAILTVNLVTLDAGFRPDPDKPVRSLAEQGDGRVLVGGEFSRLADGDCNGLGRLAADGRLETAFLATPGARFGGLGLGNDGTLFALAYDPQQPFLDPFVIAQYSDTGAPMARMGLGWDGIENSLTIAMDGSVVAAGYFSLGERPVARVLPDGSRDPAFPANPSSGQGVSLAVQRDGSILVGGTFYWMGGASRVTLARLLTNGVADPTFNPGTDGTVQALLVQPDGRILVGGRFRTLAGVTRGGLGRLNPDGTLDPTFDPGQGATEWAAVNSLALQADGKILVAGEFTSFGGVPRGRLARILPDGRLDLLFDPGVDGPVNSIALLRNGDLVVGGGFTQVAGQPRTNLARLHNTDPASDSLRFDGHQVDWLRGGSAPEFSRATFEASTNGLGWFLLDGARPTAGGWQVIGLSLPPEASIRARGYVAVGGQYGSAWRLETLSGAPVLRETPAHRTNDFGTTATFAVAVDTGTAVGFRWQKNGAPLDDNRRIEGSRTETLTLLDVVGADAGEYSVAVTNADGTTISLPAVLTVRDPLVLGNPAHLSLPTGGTGMLHATVAGSLPMTFAWYREGADAPVATTPELSFTEVTTDDAGSYFCIVSNAWGRATSQPATLTVNASVPDRTFEAAIVGESPAVLTVAVQTDGKIVVGGRFTTVGGQPLENVARLNPDGTPDPAFRPKGGACCAFDSQVTAVAIQPDGKIVVGGQFTSLGGAGSSNLGRLNPDGSPDGGFAVDLNGPVRCLALAGPNRVLVNGSGSPQLVALWSNGAIDWTFHPAVGGIVTSLAVEDRGSVLVGGEYIYVGADYWGPLVRFSRNGTPDPTFKPALDGPVDTVVVQPDRRILLGGRFLNIAGQPRRALARLQSDGTLDPDFVPQVPAAVRLLAVQADGKIIVVGDFATLNGVPRNGIGRLHRDGTLDNTFDPATGPGVSTLAVEPAGRVLIGSTLSATGAPAPAALSRFENPGTIADSLTFQDHVIRWFRDGPSAEFAAVLFSIIEDGRPWDIDPAPTYRDGAWELTGVYQYKPAQVRAYGWIAGSNSGANWMIERTIPAGPPVITRQPVSLNAYRGVPAAFSVGAVGSEPFQYQWLKDGGALRDGDRIAGTRTDTLTLTSVAASDEGEYSVFVANSFAAVASLPATLRIQSPPSPPQLAITLTGIAGSPVLHLWGDVGGRYAIEFCPELSGGAGWQLLAYVTMSVSPRSFPLDVTSNPAATRFYRARVAEPAQQR